MNNRIKITCAFLALSFSIMAQDIDYKPFSEWSHKTEGTSQYYFYTPSNIPSGKKIPLAIFLHGCCGTDNIARPRNAVDPGARVWHNFGDNYQSEPMYIVAGATSSGWTQHFPNLKKVIDDLISAGKVDPQRVYITGFSMGGRGTWDFINAYPNYFAAAIPMGMAPAGDFVNRYNMPIFINTADNDSYAPVSTVMNNVSSIRNKYGYDKGGETWQTGVNPKWHVYPGGHGVEQWMSTQSEGITLFNNTRWTFDTDNGYLDWALSKINDGNVYPSVWFESPSYMQKFENAGKIQIQIKAVDIDGSIEKVELFKYNVLIATINQLSNGFYNAELEILDGDTKISAKAYDNKGKTAISKAYDNKGKTAISISFFPSAVGTANLTVTIKDDAGIDLNGKDSYQQTFKITVLSQFNSLYNVKSESTNFYPNPTVKTLHSNKPLQLVAVFGINGLKLKEFTNTQEINISDLAAGSYISRYIDETGKNGKQLIVKME